MGLSDSIRWSWEITETDSITQFGKSALLEAGYVDNGAYRTPEDPSQMKQSLLSALILGMIRSPHESVFKNPWSGLTSVEQGKVMDALQMTYKLGTVVVASTDTWTAEIWLKYLMSTFAHTTLRMVGHACMSDIVDSYMDATGTSDIELDALERVGLLVVEVPLGGVRGLKFVEGQLDSLFRSRKRHGRLTVFFPDLSASRFQAAVDSKDKALLERILDTLIPTCTLNHMTGRSAWWVFV